MAPGTLLGLQRGPIAERQFQQRHIQLCVQRRHTQLPAVQQGRGHRGGQSRGGRRHRSHVLAHFSKSSGTRNRYHQQRQRLYSARGTGDQGRQPPHAGRRLQEGAPHAAPVFNVQDTCRRPVRQHFERGFAVRTQDRSEARHGARRRRAARNVRSGVLRQKRPTHEPKKYTGRYPTSNNRQVRRVRETVATCKRTQRTQRKSMRRRTIRRTDKPRRRFFRERRMRARTP